MNAKNWKYYMNDLQITTNGLWIPEIPYQMIIRFTKENDLVWSMFGGSGIDYKICNILNRKCIITDLNPQYSYIQQADVKIFKYYKQFDLILSHPPYWNIVKYSDDKNDGSNKQTLKDFIIWWKQIVNNVKEQLKDKGYFILACGNIYKNSEEIELGELLKNVLLATNKFVLKQHIIKDYGETKGKDMKNYNLNYYRQLKGGYGNFYGDNIYILQKKKSKNNLKEIYNIIYEKI